MKSTKRSSSSSGFEESNDVLTAVDPYVAFGARALSPDLVEFIEQTRTDAFAAHDCIQLLLELLEGCPPGHQVSAGCLASTLTLVQAYLGNVVDGMRASAMH